VDGLLPAGVGTSRTTGVLNGYAAGIAEARLVNGFQSYAFGNLNSSPGDLLIGTSASLNQLAATFKFRDVASNFQGFALEFGDLNNPGNTSRSAFIDDRLFGARQSAARTSQVGGNDALFASAAMVTFDVVPNTEYFTPGTGPCQCQFVRWGFFTFDIQGVGQPRTRGHINTWVAGDLPNPLALPAGGTATYTGHAVGTVNNGGAIYIAGGKYMQAWNFATNTGAAVINNFDGQTVGFNSLSAANRRDFSGGVSTVGFTGGLAGSFVQGGGSPAAEVMGRFAFGNAGYAAAGTFAARQ